LYSYVSIYDLSFLVVKTKISDAEAENEEAQNGEESEDDAEENEE